MGSYSRTMKYLKQTNENDPDRYIIIRVADQANIPTDPDNVDYQAFLEWVDEGNEPAEWQPDE